MKTLFVWGAGGVGKSHCALRLAARSEGRVKVLTLDPSRRLFHLVGARGETSSLTVTVAGKSFELIATDAGKLFQDLDRKTISKPGVRILYHEMVKGLKDFRNYLDLIQIGDEIHSQSCDLLIIDTPPFQEALGLHRAMIHLQRFFEASLISWAMRIGDSFVMQATVKRIFSLFHFFSGKETAQNLYEFINWLSQHSERFARSARAIQKLLHSTDTTSICVVHPESPFHFLEVFEKSFPTEHQISFLMNRSVRDEKIPSRDDVFLREIRELQRLEGELEIEIQKRFATAQIARIPLILMGDDTPEELQRFVLA